MSDDDPASTMHPDIRSVFDHFKDDDVAVFGSATADANAARDIDVLVPADKWLPLMERLRVQYNRWQTPRGLVQRANVRVPNVQRQVQLCSVDRVKSFTDHPHCVLLRDGTRLNRGVYFQKRKLH